VNICGVNICDVDICNVNICDVNIYNVNICNVISGIAYLYLALNRIENWCYTVRV
jgi:hypothetical protein